MSGNVTPFVRPPQAPPEPQPSPADPVTVLVLGCGRKQDPKEYGFARADGTPVPTEALKWITLDADPYVTPMLLCTLGEDPIALPDDSVDLIVAIHVLEHIGVQGRTKEWFQFWEEAYRVLRPDGRLQFECPLSSSMWAWADPTHSRAINEQVFLYFDQNAYRIKGSAIPTYRVKCDFRVVQLRRSKDYANPDVAALEEHSMLGGILQARKPLKPWWEDGA